MEIDDVQDVFGRLAQVDLTALDEVRWNPEKPGAELMYQRLWQNDADYGTKYAICDNKHGVPFVETESSSYWADVEPFTPWVNDGECASHEMDWNPNSWNKHELMPQITDPPDIPAYFAPAPDAEESKDSPSGACAAQQPLLIVSVLVGVLLKRLLRM